MRMRQSRLLAIMAKSILLALAGCGQAQPGATAASMPPREGAAVDTRGDLTVEARLREIAQHLQSGQYTAIGGWQAAITWCAFLPPAASPSMDWSDAAADTPHGLLFFALPPPPGAAGAT